MRAYKNKIRINLQRGTKDKQEQKFVKRYLCYFALNMQKIQRKHWQPQECSFVFYLHFKFNFLFFFTYIGKALIYTSKDLTPFLCGRLCIHVHTNLYPVYSFNIIFFLGANIECIQVIVYATLFIYGKHLVSWQWRPSTPSWFDTQLFFNITGACQDRTSLNRFLMGTVSHTRESRQGLSIIHCESAKWFSFS